MVIYNILFIQYACLTPGSITIIATITVTITITIITITITIISTIIIMIVRLFIMSSMWSSICMSYGQFSKSHIQALR